MGCNMGNAAKNVKSLSKHALDVGLFDGNNMWNASMGKFTDLYAIDIDGNKKTFDGFLGQVLLYVMCAYSISSESSISL